MKRFIISMLLLFAVLLSACGGVTQDDSNQSSEPEILEDIDDAGVPYSVTRASFEAELTCNGQTVVPDSVFEVENLVEHRLVLKNKTGRLCMGMMLFADGIPLDFTVGGETKRYVEFSFTERKTVDFTYSASDIPADGSDVHVVLLTNRDNEARTKDILKNYTFSISYTAKGNGEKRTASKPIEIVYESIADKINASDADETQKKNALSLLEQNTLVSHIGGSMSMNAGYVDSSKAYDENVQKSRLFVYGKAGDYTSTVFCDGKQLGDTFAFSLPDSETLCKLQFEKPDLTKSGAERTVYALTYSHSEKRFYDAQEYLFADPWAAKADNDGQRFYINGIDTAGEKTLEYTGGEIECKIERNVNMSIEKYDVKFVLLVDGVPCEFTVDGKTSYVHQYTVKSKNVFGFSFVPKTRGGDAFTVTLFAINSANPYLPNLSAGAATWATTSVKCADGVRPQEISGMRKPSLIEEYDSQGSSGMFGRYIINGVSNGSSDRTITIEKNSGIEVILELQFADGRRKNPIAFLLLDDELIDICDISCDYTSFKTDVRFVVPAEKVKSGEMSFVLLTTGDGRSNLITDTWMVYAADDDVIDDCSIMYDDEKLTFRHSGDGCVFIMTHTPNDPLKILRKPIVYSFSGRDADAALMINGSQYRNATIQTYSHENGIYRFTRRVITPYDK